jgi:cytochrome c553
MLPVLMALLLLGAVPHAHAFEGHGAEVSLQAGRDGHEQGGKAAPCGVHCAMCHPASLPPLGFVTAPPVAATRLDLAGPDTIRLGRADDTPQRPPRLTAIA